jgi:uncharacterized protein DUF4781
VQIIQHGKPVTPPTPCPATGCHISAGGWTASYDPSAPPQKRFTVSGRGIQFSSPTGAQMWHDSQGVHTKVLGGRSADDLNVGNHTNSNAPRGSYAWQALHNQPVPQSQIASVTTVPLNGTSTPVFAPNGDRYKAAVKGAGTYTSYTDGTVLADENFTDHVTVTNKHGRIIKNYNVQVGGPNTDPLTNPNANPMADPNAGTNLDPKGVLSGRAALADMPHSPGKNNLVPGGWVFTTNGLRRGANSGDNALGAAHGPHKTINGKLIYSNGFGTGNKPPDANYVEALQAFQGVKGGMQGTDQLAPEQTEARQERLRQEAQARQNGADPTNPVLPAPKRVPTNPEANAGADLMRAAAGHPTPPASGNYATRPKPPKGQPLERVPPPPPPRTPLTRSERDAGNASPNYVRWKQYSRSYITWQSCHAELQCIQMKSKPPKPPAPSKTRPLVDPAKRAYTNYWDPQKHDPTIAKNNIADAQREQNNAADYLRRLGKVHDIFLHPNAKPINKKITGGKGLTLPQQIDDQALSVRMRKGLLDTHYALMRVDPKMLEEMGLSHKADLSNAAVKNYKAAMDNAEAHPFDKAAQKRLNAAQKRVDTAFGIDKKTGMVTSGPLKKLWGPTYTGNPTTTTLLSAAGILADKTSDTAPLRDMARDHPDEFFKLAATTDVNSWKRQRDWHHADWVKQGSAATEAAQELYGKNNRNAARWVMAQVHAKGGNNNNVDVLDTLIRDRRTGDWAPWTFFRIRQDDGSYKYVDPTGAHFSDDYLKKSELPDGTQLLLPKNLAAPADQPTDHQQVSVHHGSHTARDLTMLAVGAGGILLTVASGGIAAPAAAAAVAATGLTAAAASGAYSAYEGGKTLWDRHKHGQDMSLSNPAVWGSVLNIIAGAAFALPPVLRVGGMVGGLARTGSAAGALSAAGLKTAGAAGASTTRLTQTIKTTNQVGLRAVQANFLGQLPLTAIHWDDMNGKEKRDAVMGLALGALTLRPGRAVANAFMSRSRSPEQQFRPSENTPGINAVRQPDGRIGFVITEPTEHAPKPGMYKAEMLPDGSIRWTMSKSPIPGNSPLADIGTPKPLTRAQVGALLDKMRADSPSSPKSKAEPSKAAKAIGETLRVTRRLIVTGLLSVNLLFGGTAAARHTPEPPSSRPPAAAMDNHPMGQRNEIPPRGDQPPREPANENANPSPVQRDTPTNPTPRSPVGPVFGPFVPSPISPVANYLAFQTHIDVANTQNTSQAQHQDGLTSASNNQNINPISVQNPNSPNITAKTPRGLDGLLRQQLNFEKLQAKFGDVLPSRDPMEFGIGLAGGARARSAGGSTAGVGWWRQSGGLGRAGTWVQLGMMLALPAAVVTLGTVGAPVGLSVMGGLVHTWPQLLSLGATGLALGGMAARNAATPTLGPPSRRSVFASGVLLGLGAAVGTVFTGGGVHALIPAALGVMVGFHGISALPDSRTGTQAGGHQNGASSGGNQNSALSGGRQDSAPSETTPTPRFQIGRPLPRGMASAFGAALLAGGGGLAVLGAGAVAPLLVGAGAAVAGFGALAALRHIQQARGPPGPLGTLFTGAALLFAVLVLGGATAPFTLVADAGFAAAITVMAGLDKITAHNNALPELETTYNNPATVVQRAWKLAARLAVRAGLVAAAIVVLTATPAYAATTGLAGAAGVLTAATVVHVAVVAAVVAPAVAVGLVGVRGYRFARAGGQGRRAAWAAGVGAAVRAAAVVAPLFAALEPVLDLPAVAIAVRWLARLADGPPRLVAWRETPTPGWSHRLAVLVANGFATGVAITGLYASRVFNDELAKQHIVPAGSLNTLTLLGAAAAFVVLGMIWNYLPTRARTIGLLAFNTTAYVVYATVTTTFGYEFAAVMLGVASSVWVKLFSQGTNWFRKVSKDRAIRENKNLWFTTTVMEVLGLALALVLSTMNNSQLFLINHHAGVAPTAWISAGLATLATLGLWVTAPRHAPRPLQFTREVARDLATFGPLRRAARKPYLRLPALLYGFAAMDFGTQDAVGLIALGQAHPILSQIAIYGLSMGEVMLTAIAFFGDRAFKKTATKTGQIPNLDEEPPNLLTTYPGPMALLMAAIMGIGGLIVVITATGPATIGITTNFFTGEIGATGLILVIEELVKALVKAQYTTQQQKDLEDQIEKEAVEGIDFLSTIKAFSLALLGSQLATLTYFNHNPLLPAQWPGTSIHITLAATVVVASAIIMQRTWLAHITTQLTRQAAKHTALLLGKTIRAALWGGIYATALAIALTHEIPDLTRDLAHNITHLARQAAKHTTQLLTNTIRAALWAGIYATALAIALTHEIPDLTRDLAHNITHLARQAAKHTTQLLTNTIRAALWAGIYATALAIALTHEIPDLTHLARRAASWLLRWIAPGLAGGLVAGLISWGFGLDTIHALVLAAVTTTAITIALWWINRRGPPPNNSNHPQNPNTPSTPSPHNPTSAAAHRVALRRLLLTLLTAVLLIGPMAAPALVAGAQQLADHTVGLIAGQPVAITVAVVVVAAPAVAVGLVGVRGYRFARAGGQGRRAAWAAGVGAAVRAAAVVAPLFAALEPVLDLPAVAIAVRWLARLADGPPRLVAWRETPTPGWSHRLAVLVANGFATGVAITGLYASRVFNDELAKQHIVPAGSLNTLTLLGAAAAFVVLGMIWNYLPTRARTIGLLAFNTTAYVVYATVTTTFGYEFAAVMLGVASSVWVKLFSQGTNWFRKVSKDRAIRENKNLWFTTTVMEVLGLALALVLSTMNNSQLFLINHHAGVAPTAWISAGLATLATLGLWVTAPRHAPRPLQFTREVARDLATFGPLRRAARKPYLRLPALLYGFAAMDFGTQDAVGLIALGQAHPILSQIAIYGLSMGEVMLTAIAFFGDRAFKKTATKTGQIPNLDEEPPNLLTTYPGPMALLMAAIMGIGGLIVVITATGPATIGITTNFFTGEIGATGLILVIEELVKALVKAQYTTQQQKDLEDQIEKEAVEGIDFLSTIKAFSLALLGSQLATLTYFNHNPLLPAQWPGTSIHITLAATVVVASAIILQRTWLGPITRKATQKLASHAGAGLGGVAGYALVVWGGLSPLAVVGVGVAGVVGWVWQARQTARLDVSRSPRGPPATTALAAVIGLAVGAALADPLATAPAAVTVVAALLAWRAARPHTLRTNATPTAGGAGRARWALRIGVVALATTTLLLAFAAPAIAGIAARVAGRPATVLPLPALAAAAAALTLVIGAWWVTVWLILRAHRATPGFDLLNRWVHRLVRAADGQAGSVASRDGPSPSWRHRWALWVGGGFAIGVAVFGLFAVTVLAPGLYPAVTAGLLAGVVVLLRLWSYLARRGVAVAALAVMAGGYGLLAVSGGHGVLGQVAGVVLGFTAISWTVLPGLIAEWTQPVVATRQAARQAAGQRPLLLRDGSIDAFVLLGSLLVLPGLLNLQRYLLDVVPMGAVALVMGAITAVAAVVAAGVLPSERMITALTELAKTGVLPAQPLERERPTRKELFRSPLSGLRGTVARLVAGAFGFIAVAVAAFDGNIHLVLDHAPKVWGALSDYRFAAGAVLLVGIAVVKDIRTYRAETRGPRGEASSSAKPDSGGGSLTLMSSLVLVAGWLVAVTAFAGGGFAIAGILVGGILAEAAITGMIPALRELNNRHLPENQRDLAYASQTFIKQVGQLLSALFNGGITVLGWPGIAALFGFHGVALVIAGAASIAYLFTVVIKRLATNSSSVGRRGLAGVVAAGVGGLAGYGLIVGAGLDPLAVAMAALAGVAAWTWQARHASGHGTSWSQRGPPTTALAAMIGLAVGAALAGPLTGAPATVTLAAILAWHAARPHTSGTPGRARWALRIGMLAAATATLLLALAAPAAAAVAAGFAVAGSAGWAGLWPAATAGAGLIVVVSLGLVWVHRRLVVTGNARTWAQRAAAAATWARTQRTRNDGWRDGNSVSHRRVFLTAVAIASGVGLSSLYAARELSHGIHGITGIGPGDLFVLALWGNVAGTFVLFPVWKYVPTRARSAATLALTGLSYAAFALVHGALGYQIAAFTLGLAASSWIKLFNQAMEWTRSSTEHRKQNGERVPYASTLLSVLGLGLAAALTVTLFVQHVLIAAFGSVHVAAWASAGMAAAAAVALVATTPNKPERDPDFSAMRLLTDIVFGPFRALRNTYVLVMTAAYAFSAAMLGSFDGLWDLVVTGPGWFVSLLIYGLISGDVVITAITWYSEHRAARHPPDPNQQDVLTQHANPFMLGMGFFMALGSWLVAASQHLLGRPAIGIAANSVLGEAGSTGMIIAVDELRGKYVAQHLQDDAENANNSIKAIAQAALGAMLAAHTFDGHGWAGVSIQIALFGTVSLIAALAIYFWPHNGTSGSIGRHGLAGVVAAGVGGLAGYALIVTAGLNPLAVATTALAAVATWTWRAGHTSGQGTSWSQRGPPTTALAAMIGLAIGAALAGPLAGASGVVVIAAISGWSILRNLITPTTQHSASRTRWALRLGVLAAATTTLLLTLAAPAIAAATLGASAGSSDGGFWPTVLAAAVTVVGGIAVLVWATRAVVAWLGELGTALAAAARTVAAEARTVARGSLFLTGVWVGARFPEVTVLVAAVVLALLPEVAAVLAATAGWVFGHDLAAPARRWWWAWSARAPPRLVGYGIALGVLGAWWLHGCGECAAAMGMAMPGPIPRIFDRARPKAWFFTFHILQRLGPIWSGLLTRFIAIEHPLKGETRWSDSTRRLSSSSQKHPIRMRLGHPERNLSLPTAGNRPANFRAAPSGSHGFQGVSLATAVPSTARTPGQAAVEPVTGTSANSPPVSSRRPPTSHPGRRTS